MKAKGQEDTDEGYGRLDALNRIGNQVFYIDFVTAVFPGFENNIHANDAPVSYPADLDRAVAVVGAIRRFDRAAADPQCRRGARRLARCSTFRPTFRRTGFSARRSRWKIWCASKTMLRGTDPFSRTPKGFGGLHRRNGPRISSPTTRLENQSGACRQGPRALRQHLRRMPPRPRRRPRIRRAISGQEFLDGEHTLEAGPGRRLDHGRSPEERRRHGYGSGTGQRAGDTTRFRSPASSSWIPRKISGRDGSARTCRPIPRPRCRSPIALMIVVDRVSRNGWTIAASRIRSRSGALGRAKQLSECETRNRIIAPGR